MEILKGGSGVSVEKHNDIVFKSVDVNNTNKFIHLKNQYMWLQYFNTKFNFIPIPIKDQFYGDLYGYQLEYFKHEEHVIDSMNIKQILHIIDDIKNTNFCLLDSNNDFSIYIDRLKNHIRNNRQYKLFYSLIKESSFIINGKKINNINFIEYFSMLEEMKDFFEENYSCCHGDFTLENILSNCGKFALIDPNFIVDGWNSWLLDISKLYQSMHFDYEETFSDSTTLEKIDNNTYNIVLKNMDNKFNLLEKEVSLKYGYIENLEYALLLLEISHYIRMLKYKYKISNDDYIKAYLRLCQIWTYLKERIQNEN